MKIVIRIVHLALLGLVLFTGVTLRASPPHEHWKRDHPRPAAKPRADLNVGEPRTVRTIYFLPNDRPYRQEVADSIKVRIRQVQAFFAEQMEAHGYGNTTFRIETDAQGEPKVHRVDGQYPDGHYFDRTTIVYDEIDQVFDLRENIYLVVVDNSRGDAFGIGGGRIVGGTGWRENKKSGSALVPASVDLTTVAHELGHAFGLWHDFRDRAFIMSYGNEDRFQLSICSAEFLEVHPYFDPDSSLESDRERRPTVEFTSSPTYAAGTARVPIQIKVTDSEGLHQVIFTVNTRQPHFSAGVDEVHACRGLSGETETVVEFEYDGFIPSSRVSSLSDPAVHQIGAQVVNSDGEVGSAEFLISEVSPHLITTLAAHTDGIHSVSFSPDGAFLATGSNDGTVTLWDVETRTRIASLEGHADGIYSLSFTPDRALLATGSSDGTVTLWDVETWNPIASLESHTDGIFSMSFTSDGALLATGSNDGTITLWDVENRNPIASLEGHTGRIHSLSFSPDGALLASGLGGWGGELWDVGTRTVTQTLQSGWFFTGGIYSVSFSPDGALLAWGLGDGRIYLWDMGTGTPQLVYDFRIGGHGRGVTSLSFSPGGSVLASGSVDRTVILWDLLSLEKTVEFAHTSGVGSVSLSPDGARLAGGGDDGKVLLWNTPNWIAPRSWELEIVSGDGQQGVPGEALAQPLVVEVRDQYGDLLPDAAVTFTVTAGQGQLSGRFSVKHVTTDADGRAELPLTLGLHPGLNTVGVSIGGRELATFTAEGVGTAVAELEGDFRTWHLPEGGTARLGKGFLRGVALSADGQYLAVASSIGVWLYETATSRALALLPTESPVASVSFSLQGTLAVGLLGQVELWEVETGKRTGTLTHAKYGRVMVVFSSDGTQLAAGASQSREQVVQVWDVEPRRLVGTWEVSVERVAYGSLPVAFSPDGTRLVSGFYDGTVRLWDLATQTEVATLEGYTGPVNSVSFSPNGSLVASAGGIEDYGVRLWDVETQEVSTLRGHRGQVTLVSFSPDGAILASGGRDGTVRLWDAATRTPIATHKGRVNSVTFSPDGATLVSSSISDGRVLLRNLETGDVVEISEDWRSSSMAPSMALSPDGATLASGHRDGILKLWDTAATPTPIATFKGHRRKVSSLSFSPDGAILASGGGNEDPTVRLWDVATQMEVATLEGHTHLVESVSFSPDGALLASAGYDRTVRLWDVAGQTELATLRGHDGRVRSVSFSPDGALLASGGGYDSTVKLWDVETHDLIGTLGHEVGVHAVAISPDGKTLASLSEYKFRLWDMETQTQIATFPNSWSRSESQSLAFSYDGQYIFIGAGRTVLLLDVGSMEVVSTLENGHTHPINTLALSRDGTTLASCSDDGIILLWDLQPIFGAKGRTVPRTMLKVAGDQQQGPFNSALPNPFSVQVQDQDGNPLEGVEVTFAVTAGGGTLSATTATTDANGRAESTLTLGRQLGPNTVEVTVADLDPVVFSAVGQAVPQTLAKVSGDEQEGPVSGELAEPFVVSVLDQNGTALAGAAVTFAVKAGEGTLSATTATTDANGRASSILTLGSAPGANTVEAAVAGLEPVTFTAAAEATSDFDGDGKTDFSDFFLFADAFGGSDPRFDLDGSGSVDFADFFLLADHFADPAARGKLLALARDLIGLPDGSQLTQNVPNPFNSQTVISWFQLQTGPARVEVFALTGQRVAVLQEGPEKAGIHRVFWNGRDDRGRPLASGVYLYRLVTEELVQTRKLTLLR